MAQNGVGCGRSNPNRLELPEPASCAPNGYKLSTSNAPCTSNAAGHVLQGLRSYWAWVCVTVSFMQLNCRSTNAMVRGSHGRVMPLSWYAYTHVTSFIQNLITSVTHLWLLGIVDAAPIWPVFAFLSDYCSNVIDV